MGQTSVLRRLLSRPLLINISGEVGAHALPLRGQTAERGGERTAETGLPPATGEGERRSLCDAARCFLTRLTADPYPRSLLAQPSHRHSL